MFNASRIAALLRAAGLPWRHASELANVLGNRKQVLKTGGRLEQDTTPSDLSLVTPEARKHHLTNVDFLKGDPDYRAAQISESEASRTPEPDPAVKTLQAPQETDAAYNLLDGAFTRVVGAGGAVAVNVAVQGAGRAVFLDPPSNSLVGKTLRCEAGGAGQNLVRFFIDENGREVVFKLQLNTDTIPVVTAVRFAKGRGLVCTVQNATIFKPINGKPYEKVVPTISAPVVSSIVTEGSQQIANNAALDVLGASDRPPTTLAGGGGSLLLCYTGTGWSQGTSQTVPVYEGEPFFETATGDTVVAYNRYGNIGAGKFCSVALHTSGYYYVVAADCST